MSLFEDTMSEELKENSLKQLQSNYDFQIKMLAIDDRYSPDVRNFLNTFLMNCLVVSCPTCKAAGSALCSVPKRDGSRWVNGFHEERIANAAQRLEILTMPSYAMAKNQILHILKIR